MNLFDIVAPLTIEEAKTDYQKRRQRERDVDAGKPVSRQAKNPQTDYAKKRAKEKKELELGEAGGGWGLDPKTRLELKKRRERQKIIAKWAGVPLDKNNEPDKKNELDVKEDSWHGDGNAWSSEHDQWTKESAEPVTELKIDPRKAKPGQTQDEKYKGWNLRYQMRPATGSKEYKGRADNLQSQKTQPIGPISAASAEELLQQLKDAIDSSRGSNAITTGRVTIFFNANLAKEVIGHGGDIYADIEQHGDTPLLLLSTEDQGGMIRAQDRSSVAVKGRDGHIGAQAFAFPADKAKAAGLTLARYALGQPINYAPGITAIPLEFRNEVYPGETVRMDEPGLTVSPPKMGQTMGEDGMIGPDSTSPVGGHVDEAKLNVGDPIIVTAPNEFEGKTGEISEFSPSGKFVIVNLYNHGKHSMHLSDVEYNQYADDQDADEYSDDEIDEDTGPSPVAGAITRRILQQRLDLLKQYGPELVGAAVDNVADYVGDVEEIGSSDVSAWVAQVERMLKENPPEAFAEGWSDAIVAQRTGRPRTPYSVYIKGKKWKDFENEDHADAVADKLRAKFKADGRDPSVITIAATDYDKQGVEEVYTPSPAKPFRNPPGFNKQGTGVGNKLADLNRAELANIKPSTGTPVPAKEFARGVLKDLKKVNVKEVKADPAGSWVVYGGSKVMKFKTHGGAKAYAEKNGGKVASSEFYADKVQKQGVAEGDDQVKKVFKDKSGNPGQISGRGANTGKNAKPVVAVESYWTKLQDERNTKIASLIDELKESIK